MPLQEGEPPKDDDAEIRDRPVNQDEGDRILPCQAKHQQPGEARLHYPNPAWSRHRAQYRMAEGGDEDQWDAYGEIKRLHHEVQAPDLQEPPHESQDEKGR